MISLLINSQISRRKLFAAFELCRPQ